MTLLNSYIAYKALGGKVTRPEFILILSEKLNLNMQPIGLLQHVDLPTLK